MSIDAMKLALEALEEINKLSIGENAIFLPAEIDGAITALRAAIEQANEFNPDWDAMAVMVEEQQRMAKRIEELEAQQKPWVKTYAGGKPNYTVPEEQTRQWQPLTDEEIAQLRHLYDGTAGWTIERFARQIEAKIREKNHG